MNYNRVLIFTIISIMPFLSNALHGMQQDNNFFLATIAKIKSIFIARLNTQQNSVNPQNQIIKTEEQPIIKLADILKTNFSYDPYLSFGAINVKRPDAGQLIEVATDDNDTLLEYDVVPYPYYKIHPNKTINASIIPGIYRMKEKACLDDQYAYHSDSGLVYAKAAFHINFESVTKETFFGVTQKPKEYYLKLIYTNKGITNKFEFYETVGFSDSEKLQLYKKHIIDYTIHDNNVTEINNLITLQRT